MIAIGAVTLSFLLTAFGFPSPPTSILIVLCLAAGLIIGLVLPDK